MRNNLIIPALIIAASIIVGAILLRVLPPARNDVGRPSPGGSAETAPGSSFAIPDSGSASVVTAIDGNRMRVFLPFSKIRKQSEMLVVITAETRMTVRDGSSLPDRMVKKGDMIEFTPDVFPEDATEVIAETVTLIFRPPINR